RRPLAEPLAVHADLTAVRLDDAFRDRETETQPDSVFDVVGALLERQEDLCESLRCDPTARIRDFDHHWTRHPVARPQRDPTARSGRLDCVVDQVREHLLESSRIAANVVSDGTELARELDPRRARVLGPQRGYRLEHLVEIELDEPEVELLLGD